MFSILVTPIYIPANIALFSTQPSQYMLLVDLLMIAILMDVRWYLVVLIGILLKINDVEQHFMSVGYLDTFGEVSVHVF